MGLAFLMASSMGQRVIKQTNALEPKYRLGVKKITEISCNTSTRYQSGMQIYFELVC